MRATGEDNCPHPSLSREMAKTPAGSSSPLPQMSLCHGEEAEPSLTCAGAPVVGLAHPLVALTQGPEVHARLAHVTDADPAVTAAPAVAQSAPRGLPRCPAPALRLGLGEPAQGTRPASAWGDKPQQGHGQARILPLLLSARVSSQGPPRWQQTTPEAPHFYGGQPPSRKAVLPLTRVYHLSSDHDPKRLNGDLPT